MFNSNPDKPLPRREASIDRLYSHAPHLRRIAGHTRPRQPARQGWSQPFFLGNSHSALEKQSMGFFLNHDALNYAYFVANVEVMRSPSGRNDGRDDCRRSRAFWALGQDGRGKT